MRIRAYQEKMLFNSFFNKGVIDYSTFQSNLSRAVHYYNISGQSLLELFFDKTRKRDLLDRYHNEMQAKSLEQRQITSKGPFRMTLKVKETPTVGTGRLKMGLDNTIQKRKPLSEGFEVYKNNRRKLLEWRETRTRPFESENALPTVKPMRRLTRAKT